MYRARFATSFMAALVTCVLFYPTKASAQISVSTSSFSFGAVDVGDSLTQSLTISNFSSLEAPIFIMLPSASFSTDFTGLFNLAGNSSLNLGITFTPPSVGAFTGMLTLQTSDVFNPQFQISLTGSGVAAVPEPETYAMMLVGLALVGFTARRRRG